MARNTPVMEGKASEINDPHLLFERIGYRVYRTYIQGDDGGPIRIGHLEAELKQLAKLLGETKPPATDG